jgi:hypothetical protein
MGQMNLVTPVNSYTQARRYRRYRLHAPVKVSFPLGDSVLEVATVSRDVSEGGLLVESNVPLPRDSQVFLSVNVQSRDEERTVFLQGQGTVVRVEEQWSKYVIAVRCTHPLSEVESRSGFAQA